MLLQCALFVPFGSFLSTLVSFIECCAPVASLLRKTRTLWFFLSNAALLLKVCDERNAHFRCPPLFLRGQFLSRHDCSWTCSAENTRELAGHLAKRSMKFINVTALQGLLMEILVSVSLVGSEKNILCVTKISRDIQVG